MIHVKIHEDDEGMRNLWPAAVSDEVLKDMDASVEDSERNRSASGQGWDDVHVVTPPSADFTSVDLRIEQVEAALANILPRVSSFTVGETPRNPFYHHDDNPLCFGLGNELYIKFEVKDGRISHIWFDVWTSNPEKLEKLQNALQAIEAITPCVVADYWAHADGFLGNPKFVDAYIAHLAKFDGAEP